MESTQQNSVLPDGTSEVATAPDPTFNGLWTEDWHCQVCGEKALTDAFTTALLSGGRPSRFPYTRARARPDLTRSTIGARSKSVNTPIIFADA